jgi:hypothetical protein
MRTLGKIAATIGVVGAIGVTGVIPAFTITITTADGAQGTAADQVGRCRAAFVSPIGMVRGTSMEGGRATTDFNKCGGRFGGLLFLTLCPSSV